MQKFSLLARFALAAAFVSAASAQNSITLIGTTPSGAVYNVDGQNYSQPTSALWPSGSKHTLAVTDATQTNQNVGEQLVFQNWKWDQGVFAGSTITVTSDPAITAYTAVFNALYALSVNFYPCDGSGLPGPGTVYVNGAATTCDQQIYFAAGSSVAVQAMPANGYVFVGWYTATNQNIVGFQTTVTLNAPTTVYPHFAPARNINFVTSPAGLQVLADYSTVTAPITMQWGFDTIHTVGVISPQKDSIGNPWVFSSWSDGGAATHAYTVAESTTPGTLTAVFGPGVGVAFQTSPPELNLIVDGATNAPPYNFIWSMGATHTFSAPAQQTDSTGHVWGFSGWSNGGPAAQSLTLDASSIAGVRMVATYTPVGHLIINSTLAGVSVTVNGSACATPCDVKQPVGAQIAVGAPASVAQGAGSRQDLTGWTGGSTGGPSGLMVTLGTDPITVYANYHLMNYLAMTSSPANSAAWTVQPASPDGFYSAGATVAVSVAAQAGFKFQYWSGDLTGSNSSGSVAMTVPRAVQATMTKIPYIAATGIENGAGTTPVTAIAPGSVASIFGGNMAAGTAIAPANPLPQTLGGVSLMLGSRLLPLFFVSPSQMNFQLPADVPPGPATLTVVAEGAANVTATFTVVQDAPGLFQQIVNGQSFALAFHADGTLVTQTSLAQIGELLTVYGTGFGPTNPARPEGFVVPASPIYTAVDPVTVSAGSGTLTPSATFALAGSVGVDAVQFTLTDPTLSGTNAALSITINGQQSNTVLLPVQ
jgi:uncharacterized protein (TIGR03437 family)